jgi:hypothetical protein
MIRMIKLLQIIYIICLKKSCYVLSTQIAITVIYTYNMLVLFCACDVMNVLSVKKMKIYQKKKRKEEKKRLNILCRYMTVHFPVLVQAH